MPQTMQVGLTGGIGSGKSLVARIFNILGIPCYDSDLHAKLITKNSLQVKEKIIAEFGPIAYLPDGTYNRKKMADIVFNNKMLLTKLNEIIHPALIDDFDQWIQPYRHLPYVIREAALFFETGSYKQLDSIIVVTAPETIRVNRVIKRDPIRSKNQIENIIANQWHETEKVKLADFVITNDDKQLVIPQVVEIHQSLLKQSKRR